MEMENKESTESGSLESGSPGVNREVMTSPAVTGIGGAYGEADIPVSGEGKKKRGRPKKFDADGNLTASYLKTQSFKAAVQVQQQQQQPGFTLSNGFNSSGSKRGRAKHSDPGSGSGSSNNWQILGSLGELFTSTAGGDFTPHVVTVNTGEDVAGKILTFAHNGARGICVLSANGSVSNATIRQPGSSGGSLTYEGRFEILTLTGSFTVSDNGGMKSRTGGLSVSLASSDGRIIGGGVAGMLMAAAPIQIVVGTFVPNGFKTQKKRPHVEPRMTPPIQYASANVTAAVPISQAPPQSQNYSIPMSKMAFQRQGEVGITFSDGDHQSSAFANTAAWNISEPRPSPDINIAVPVEEH